MGGWGEMELRKRKYKSNKQKISYEHLTEYLTLVFI